MNTKLNPSSCCQWHPSFLILSILLDMSPSTIPFPSSACFVHYRCLPQLSWVHVQVSATILVSETFTCYNTSKPLFWVLDPTKLTTWNSIQAKKNPIFPLELFLYLLQQFRLVMTDMRKQKGLRSALIFSPTIFYRI